ncbi:MAG: hypothetical protein EA398_15335 [Deltaproteobacteria bacterium]|nr:MAG: hypothetical protein EA398_15335 [Deltaproteobacteria bacterium]
MKPLFAVVVSCLLLLTAACSTGGDVDRTFTGSLTDRTERLSADNSPFVAHRLRLREGQRVRADMNSTDFDTYMLVLLGDDTLHQNDDCPEPRGTLDSCLEFTVERSGLYTFVANSYDDTGRGSYTLRVQATTP